jgi:hypothetical protein
MDVLNQIVGKLHKEEIRKFRLLATTSLRAGQRKDLALFDYIRSSGNKFNEQKALKKTGYGRLPNNRYYQLKNRLSQNVGDSLVMLNTHKNDLYELFHQVELFHIYRSRNLFKASLVCLRKAERCAAAVEHYEMLDVIYSNFIRLSSDLPEIKAAQYIKKRDDNAKIVANLREMDNVLASLSQRLRISQNFGVADKNAMKKLQAKVQNVSKLTTSRFGKNLEARIYNALSQLLLQQHNYGALEKLIRETYLKFEREKWFDKTNHELKLQMLTYWANSLFKIDKYKESIALAERLGDEIQQFSKLHYEKYLFFYYNSLVNNYSILNPPKGLEMLLKFQKEMQQKKNTYYDFFIYLNRATFLYDIGQFNEALKNLVQLYVSPGYAEADMPFKLKIEVCELIITFESGDKESLEYRLKQIRKSFAALQTVKSLKRDFEIMNLLEKMNQSPDYRRDDLIRKKMLLLLNTKNGLGTEDSEIIKYKIWLENKLKNL